ncbi:ImmA/IrrE family metallo-endopeptidase [Bifidobacterium bombi]|uniref:IrrE N-terminal-like domain-containing protein n=1 Tax=Bifidobacterium bombi DSM 19703 TaxID=1341695 RepID=A0A080N3F2_9BIFI|nr:ImmA/IrrE family metallo-endopeptidase [Bifidobacterium bombi]KFF31688.1 hypothetical protein BBOMB_1075 [Bifidobacterium bombi DSM 19703]
MTDKIKVDNTGSPAAAATDTLLKTVGTADGRVNLPINLSDISRLLGIKMESMILDKDKAGILVKPENDDFHAVANITDGLQRQRFTYAHEIGHYIHKYQDFPREKPAGEVEERDELSSQGIDPEEIWANKFAAALLMPAAIVRQFWAEDKSVSEMANIFAVSKSAMNVRVATLGLM